MQNASNGGNSIINSITTAVWTYGIWLLVKHT